MDKLLAVDELRLSRFGEFLLRQRLIKPGSERYYVIWVRKFLTRPVQAPITSLEDRVARYLEALQSCGGYKDWQIDQAEKAVRLYFVNFTRESQASKETSTTLPKNPDGTVEGPKLIATLLDLLRVKHYAYTTERTYLGRTKRFLSYLADTGHRKPPESYAITADRVRDYLDTLSPRQLCIE